MIDRAVEDFVRRKGEEVKAALDPSKNSTNVEKLAGVGVIALRFILEHVQHELAQSKPK